MARVWWLSWIFVRVQGDGEFLVTSPSPDVSSVSSVEPTSGYIGGCNPFQGVRYLRISNGREIPRWLCSASWDIYEVELTDSTGARLAPSASTMTGVSDDHPVSNVVDGDRSSFHAGDWDIGLGCSCWDDSKIGSQQVDLDLGTLTQVARIVIVQGGDTDPWSVGNLRIECGDMSMAFDPAVMQFEISRAVTTIECTAQGCRAELSTPYLDICGACRCGTLTAVGLALLALLFG
ncbi:unnamed protein product [Durusdinium trenchii]|uniref:F5/8 type C domain-containing protein n=2 Tax=Durusdinium trenchii TaxID=1381693 RepID=A0ABP0JAP0_9DINO